MLILLSSSSIGITYYKQSLYRHRLINSITTEAARNDITAYRKNKNIKRIDSRIESSYQLRHYNPFSMQNTTNSYGLFLIVATGISIGYINRWKKREQMVENINKERIESELAYLKQQINPHFLFNALNSIYSLILPHSEEASEVILKLSSILRYMLYETDKDRVPLSRDLEIMADYIDLQKLKCTSATTVEYNFEGDFNNRYIEPLIMIPIIENAFKYGSNNTTKSLIKISVVVKDNILNFNIKNNIVVMRKNDEHSGIGLKNISRRLDLIYGKQAIFESKVQDNIFIVDLSLPLSNNLSGLNTN